MKRFIVTLAACALVASATFAASPPQSDTITVTATNGGVFTFNIVAATYAFGTVDAMGTANVGGTQAITGVRNGGNTGSTYTATTATTWTLASAPPRAVHIFNASTNAGGTFAWGISDRLEIQIPTTLLPGTPASCGFKTFLTGSGDGGISPNCTSGNLVTTFSAGNGANIVTGDLDFRLTVLDVDATGSNTWVVTLTAAAP
jgi:hypothetical protein